MRVSSTFVERAVARPWTRGCAFVGVRAKMPLLHLMQLESALADAMADFQTEQAQKKH